MTVPSSIVAIPPKKKIDGPTLVGNLLDRATEIDSSRTLDPEFKQRWLQALRSGEYRQAQGCLSRGDSFCCLGVAADLVDPTGWHTDEDGHPNIVPWGQSWGSVGVLPQETLALIRLNHMQQSILSNMNDDGKTFAEIADWIEANL